MRNNSLFEEVLQPEYLALLDSHKISVEYSNQDQRFTIGFLPTNEPIDPEEQTEVIKILTVANYISSLPDPSLKGIAYSEDLRSTFEYLEAFYDQLAKEFVITCLKIEVPELSKRELRAMNLRESDKELCTQYAEFYRALWNLICAEFSCIKEGIKNLPFEDNVTLFCEILNQPAGEALLKRASEYFSINTNEMIRLLKLMGKENLEPNEVKKILANPLVLEESWLYEILPPLAEASKQNEEIAALLLALDKAWVEEASKKCDALSARNSSGKILKSHDWVHGEKQLICDGRPPRKG